MKDKHGEFVSWLRCLVSIETFDSIDEFSDLAGNWRGWRRDVLDLTMRIGAVDQAQSAVNQTSSEFKYHFFEV